MLKKLCRTQFFEHFGYSDNLLITNVLRLGTSFLPQNTTQIPFTFKFLFGHTFQADNYIFLNISTEANCFFLRFPLFFYFQCAVVTFSAHRK